MHTGAELSVDMSSNDCSAPPICGCRHFVADSISGLRRESSDLKFECHRAVGGYEGMLPRTGSMQFRCTAGAHEKEIVSVR